MSDLAYYGGGVWIRRKISSRFKFWRRARKPRKNMQRDSAAVYALHAQSVKQVLIHSTCRKLEIHCRYK